MVLFNYYRIYETGSEINIDHLENELSHSHTISRSRFARVKTKSIQIDSPPLMLNLGSFTMDHASGHIQFSAQARIFDIGAISIRIQHEVTTGDIEATALSLAGQKGMDEYFLILLNMLQAIVKPYLGDLMIDPEFYEDYTIYVADRIDVFTDPVAILMGEKVPFSRQVREEVLRNSLSYGTDDLAIISWDTAILCDPEIPSDLMELIEFANVQLVQLRYYDDILSRQMEKMYDDIELAGRSPAFKRFRSYHKIRRELMEIYADINLVFERIKNLIKITEDVFYARVYETTLKVLRTTQWTDVLHRKMNVIAQNYNMLSDEVNVQHSYFLEWTIIVLIALEFAFAIWGALF